MLSDSPEHDLGPTMLLELAVGDAYGAGFEYAPAAFVARHNDLSGYVQHPHRKLPPGRYTDDTQMALALTEAIVDDDSWSAESLAHRFVNAFKRDPREGYAPGFFGLLLRVRDGDDLLARIRPDSDKSGAAMRAAPLGVFASAGEVIERCRVIALIMRHDSLSDLLHACVAVTGDVDTVAAMALGCAACSNEMSADLPGHLISNLENETFGREHLAEFDRQLLARAR